MPALPELSYLSECFDYDAESGWLIWRTRPLSHFPREAICAGWNTQFAGQRAGTISLPSGYINVRLNGMVHRAHRIIWALAYAEAPPDLVDHKDRNTGNNRLCNLRRATRSANQGNSKLSRKNTSGFKGVYILNGKWSARIKRNDQTLYLGYFATREDAREGYRRAAEEWFGEFANP